MGFKKRVSIEGTVPTRWRRWGTRTRAASRDDVIRALREMSDDGKRALKLRDIPSKLARALIFHFGSFVAARDAAGVPAFKTPSRWNRERIREELRQADNSGIRLTYAGLTQAGRADLAGAIRRRYDTLAAARRDAGVPEPARLPPRVSLSWSPESVLIIIIHRWENGEPLAYSQVPAVLASAGARYFGNWGEAITAAGLDYAEIRLTREAYDEDEILQILRELSSSRPDMTISELRTENTALTARASEFFGSLDEALLAAEIDDWPVRVALPLDRSKEDVITQIRARKIRGESNRALDVAADDWNLYNSATHLFWNWQEARKAAGLPPTPPNFRWSQERVVEELQARAARGQILARDLGTNLRQAARKYFGSLGKARRAAGIPTRPRRRDSQRTRDPDEP